MATDAKAADVVRVTDPEAGRLRRLLGVIRPRLVVIAPLAVVALALAIRLVRLGEPDELLVDEGYYVRGARDLLERGAEPTYMAPEEGRLPAVHPPLGKWLIALGIAAAGDEPFGWRIASALAGALTVALVYLAGRRLFRGRGAALIAAFLLAVEHLSVVQSRTAMLDIFLTLWLVAAAYALIRDHTAPGGRFRWWRLAAGVALGCAVATKWSGAYVLPVACLAVLAVAFARELTRRRRADAPDPNSAKTWQWPTPRRWPALLPSLRTTLIRELPSVIGMLVLVPVAVYVASYAGTFASGTLNLVTWWDDQVRVLLFHSGLDATHPYTSSAWSWLVMRRPITYYFERVTLDTPAGAVDGVTEVLALGNPLIFLAITPTAAWAAWRWLRHRDHAIGAVLLTALALWLPWAFQNRPMFVFYMTPVLPFVVLLQGAALGRLRRTPLGAVATTILLATAAALFWFHYPILTAAPIPYSDWLTRVADWNRIPLFHFNWI